MDVDATEGIQKGDVVCLQNEYQVVMVTHEDRLVDQANHVLQAEKRGDNMSVIEPA